MNATPAIEPTDPAADVALRVEDIWKRFGATQALRGVSMEIAAGSIHALVGRNGAGKSTLVSVITGNIKPDQGHVDIPGSEPGDVSRAVAAVYQKIRLSPYLSVAENLQLGLYDRTIIRWSEIRRQAQKTLDAWHLDVPVDMPVNHLRLDQQQLVSIARALAAGARIVILDEPTARLDWRETKELFSNIRRLSDEHGVSFLFISHSLSEVFELCDHVTVLRDGEKVADGPTSGLNEATLVSRMVGSNYELTKRGAQGATLSGDIVMDVKALSLRGLFQDASFSLRRGECLGLTSLVGGGAVAMAETLAGYRSQTSGVIDIFGRRLPKGRRDISINMGVGFVPPDRNVSGLVHELTVRQNLSLASLSIVATRLGVIRRTRERRIATSQIKDLGIVTAGMDQRVVELSGGNQQKVVMGRAAASEPTVMIIANPTVGVDIASKDVIYGRIRRALDDGVSVVVASEDELGDLDLCSRVLVLHGGRIFSELGPTRTAEDVLAAVEGVPVGRSEGV